ncbi:Gap junction alpha-1 protein [Myotis davidii]|uniref:Gap junction alpha-1 protein n=1 Tax=Myotis davidii TaxID=225400 RepID=L5LUT2_MYODS|nr:Gap junction alpha-1 protein [Myotis davidii]
MSLDLNIIKLFSVKDLESESYHNTYGQPIPFSGSSVTLPFFATSTPRDKLLSGDRNSSSYHNYNNQISEKNSANYST